MVRVASDDGIPANIPADRIEGLRFDRLIVFQPRNFNLDCTALIEIINTGTSH